MRRNVKSLLLGCVVVWALAQLGCTASVGVGVSVPVYGGWGGPWGGPYGGIYVGGPVWP